MKNSLALRTLGVPGSPPQIPERPVNNWERQLSGAPVLNLPIDRPRSAVFPSHFLWRSSSVLRELCNSLRQLCRAEQVSFSAVFLTAFQVLLLRYTGQEDLLLGCSLSDEDAVRSNRLGLAQKEFALRIDLSGDPSFQSLLKQVHGRVIEALASPSPSLREVVKNLTSESSNHDAFQVSFSYEESTRDSVSEAPVAGVPVDLHLAVRQADQDVALHLLYNADLFDSASVDRTFKNLRTLLLSIAENPKRPLSQLPILGEDEQRQILTEWNQTDCDYPRDTCLHELVEEQAQRSPNHLAVVCGERRLSYRELSARANQLAHYLQSRGVGPDERVGICLKQDLGFAIATLAVLKAGGACVPLDPKYPSERLAYMLENVQAKVVITEKGMLPEVVPSGCEVLLLAEKSNLLSCWPQTTPESVVTPENIAYVIYTSGSTGKPRGVQLAHAGLVNYLTTMGRRFCMQAEDRMLQFCSTGFDIAVEEIFVPWLSGATLVLRTDEMSIAVPEFLNWVERQGVTILDLPTAYWHEWVHHLPELKRASPPAVRLVVVGGERALASAYAAWLGSVGNGVRWINTYGPTEASIAVTAWEPKLAPGERVPDNLPIGRPLANCRTYILDGHLNPVPVGIPGELYLGGVCVARGYLNRPELTAEKFIPDPFSPEPRAHLYKTGDLARYLPSGDIDYLGRGDDQVKIRGFRIELGEIESVLSDHPSVREAVAVAREDVPGDKRLVAYVVPSSGKKLVAAELRSYLRKQLPEYMVPAALVVLQSMPLTPNGKINRRGLPAPETESAAETSRGDADAFQLQLVKIWEEVLGRRPIGIQDNFFDVLGGHSLLAARLMHRIGQAVGKTLPLTILFQAPTVQQLAAALRQDEWAQHWSSLVPIQPAGSRPPFFCVHGVGGNVLNFRELGKRMGPDYPFYGLQAQGLDGNRPCYTTIEEIAAHYIMEIKTLQPIGPYFIGGYSLGGTIAFEIAQQLRANGEQIGMLALLDTYAGNLSSVSSTVLRLLLHPAWKSFFRDLPRIAKDTVERRIKYRLMSPLLKNVLQSNQNAADRYVLRPFGGRIHLFRASEPLLRSSESLYSAWAGLASQGVEVHQITGNHGGILVRPQVDQLAEKLKACIDKNAKEASAAGLGTLHGAAGVGRGRALDAVNLQPSL